MGTNPPGGYLTRDVLQRGSEAGARLTEYPEMKVVWAAEALRDVPFLRWFAGGTFEISYGYYIQNTASATPTSCRRATGCRY